MDLTIVVLTAIVSTPSTGETLAPSAINLTAPAAAAVAPQDTIADVHAPLEFDPHLTLDVVSPAMLQDDPPASASSSSNGWITKDAAPAFGTKGSLRLNFHGGYAFQPDDTSDSLALGGASVSYFMIDNLSMDFELNGLYIWEGDDSTSGFNFNIMLRYHVIARDAWSIYLEGGAGILITGDELPDGASDFNFTPQAGAGVTYDIGSGNRLFAGVRWYHISNANIEDYNPGLDYVYIYAGLSVPF